MSSLILLAVATLSAASEPALTTGPEKGALVIVGGGRMPEEVCARFIELAGGIDAPFVIVPTANEGEKWGEKYAARSFLARRGAKNITLLHTRDRALADTEEFTAPLGNARGVWFDGGRQWRLADSYLGTRTERAFHEVLARGGVIGGSSAGATIQGSYLVRGAPEGNHIMMAKGHEQGFGFLRNCAIDQHTIARKREADMRPVIDAHPHLLGFGIDEGTALIVQGDRATVIGESKVVVTHSAQDSHSFLSPGESYNLRGRLRLK